MIMLRPGSFLSFLIMFCDNFGNFRATVLIRPNFHVIDYRKFSFSGLFSLKVLKALQAFCAPEDYPHTVWWIWNAICLVIG